MPILGFKKVMAPKVEDGSKPHTIRAKRKRPIYAGDTLYLYTGLRTKNAQHLRTVTCTTVQNIEIHRSDISDTLGVVIFIEGRVLGTTDAVELIQRDGFDSVKDFMDWFLPAKIKKFEGDLIWWA